MRHKLAEISRYAGFAAVALIALIALIGAIGWGGWWWVVALIFLALTAVGIRDMIQTRHAILRNYPLLAHFRFFFETIRPEIRQYLIESDHDEEPFSREDRSIVYQRAKNDEGARPFGTKKKVYEGGYSWMTHSIVPTHLDRHDFRVRVGGPDCKKPYDASLYNISAMSFGALSANAVEAMNRGAAIGGFAHDTGEGGISKFHRFGGDLIFEVGSGYFGCRTEDGRFDPEKFAKTASDDQVKMIEIKLSQGAKPGHGGMLPAAKISPEIAEARGVPMGQDCISPASHSEFSTPKELCEFIGKLRDLSGGKPVGFKLCIGHRREFMCIVKAMIETDIYPDFIVVDGTEGGTGAAPMEFANHVGMPLTEGLSFVHNVLRGADIRHRIRIGASGKLIHAYHIARAFALGADWCNSARGFMFSVGCIQAQACHTNHCPTGVTTQDPLRQKALVVPDKAQRVANFHRNTLRALAEMTGAAGLDDPRDFLPYHFMSREGDGDMMEASDLWTYLPVGFLVRDVGYDNEVYRRRWNRASADTFKPPEPIGRKLTNRDVKSLEAS
ncbi:FMN-binding glutamate synthase family protein [Palleronia caenipelagi]|uniref:FMN-binding glutamate synthase family protein n=1 Tax=Palleronia caenipelagi TaxID=2489174 RepID=A0A547Q599_9RHOB|nr:FMN-binding glutamate synthase family protein [Palleronia caenipelagi]TRD21562.1 FMN-binding glutamate synthase family protein [Palleronia caenipelagi]